VREFYSAPTLEPSITTGNEAAVTAALRTLGIDTPTLVDPARVDEIFQNAGRRRKGEFALQLAAELSRRQDASEPVAVPNHFHQVFDYLYSYQESLDADSPPSDN
jgi:putative ATP-dependent endonuclease of OLD family